MSRALSLAEGSGASREKEAASGGGNGEATLAT